MKAGKDHTGLLDLLVSRSDIALAIGVIGSFIFQSSDSGTRRSWEFRACSHVTSCPV